MAHIHIEDLSFSYPGANKRCLDSVSVTIEKGEYVLLCGQSGSGKTTLLRHLKSCLAPHGEKQGAILLDGAPLEQLSLREQAAKIGFVMQNPDDQIVTDKVWHELSFGLESLGCDQKTMRLRVAEMASYFGTQDWFHREVSQLSGGQKQLLNLAAIMAMQPEILILDEPTSQLDPLAASDFLSTLRKINTELGTTIFITEHRLEDIYPAADKVLVMDSGRIIAQGEPGEVSQVLWKENHPMFAALPTPVRAFYASGAEGKCPLTVREGRSWLSRAFQNHPPHTLSPAGEETVSEASPALTLRECWYRYEKDSPDILKGVSLSVPQGSLFAVVGANGAGKSTMLKAICQICKPYRGKVELFGVPAHKQKRLFSGCVAMLPQDPKSLFVKATAQEELAEMNTDTVQQERVAALCEISHLLHRHPWDLSGGEQQRLALAKVLLTNPRLLLLDEPTKGLDPFFKIQFAAILQKLKDSGVTILMVSHDVEFCAEYADLTGMFFDGQIITVNTPRAFFSQNSFYTTAANRMSRCVFQGAVTAEDVVSLYKQNQEG